MTVKKKWSIDWQKNWLTFYSVNWLTRSKKNWSQTLLQRQNLFWQPRFSLPSISLSRSFMPSTTCRTQSTLSPLDRPRMNIHLATIVTCLPRVLLSTITNHQRVRASVLSVFYIYPHRLSMFPFHSSLAAFNTCPTIPLTSHRTRSSPQYNHHPHTTK